MEATTFVLGFILLTQVCGGPYPNETESPGMLQTLLEKASETQASVQSFGATAMGFFSAYYEDHIQPVTESYKEWASDITNDMWAKTQATILDYMPFKSPEVNVTIN